MGTEGVNPDAKLTALLVASNCFHDDPFVLVDVGVSGGESSYWWIFDNDLRVIGFDPLTTEIERLNRLGRGPNRRYFAAHLGSPEHSEMLQDSELVDAVASRNNQSWDRTSTARAAKLMAYDQTVDYQGGNRNVILSEERFSLDSFCEDHSQQRVDFIKIDTDGHDLEVLLGAKSTLEKSPVLGVMVETQFHGPLHRFGNTFVNIDSYLRSNGFSLFDMASYRYSRAALPLPFVYEIPAQTHGGQILWADILYVRDVANPLYGDQWMKDFSLAALLKLSCIFDLHGLADCAAEVILTGQDRLEPFLRDKGLSSEQLLNEVTPKLGKKPVTYRQYIEAFEDDPSRFFPRKQAQGLRRWRRPSRL